MSYKDLTDEAKKAFDKDLDLQKFFALNMARPEMKDSCAAIAEAMQNYKDGKVFHAGTINIQQQPDPYAGKRETIVIDARPYDRGIIRSSNIR